jgi:hypothetical protein
MSSKGKAPSDADGFSSVEPRDGSCVVIGPAQSGKTTLLLAMQQACLQVGQNRRHSSGENPYEQHAGDGYKLDFVPESDSTTDLVSLAGEFLFRGKKVQASREVTEYSFRVFLNDMEKPGPEIVRQITVTDGPGGYLFPGEAGWRNAQSSAWKDLLDRTRCAQNLILCVDGSNPAVGTLYHGLPHLILHLKGEQTRLPYRRVLLLTTKIDRVIDSFQRAPERRTADRSRRYPGFAFRWNSARIASLLDPVAQTRQILGKVIEMLQGSLASDATLAVGLCSALGFDRETGASFASTARHEICSTTTMAVRLRGWEPFGVREAILFLLVGEAQHPIAEVRREASGLSLKSWNVSVPSYV